MYSRLGVVMALWGASGAFGLCPPSGSPLKMCGTAALGCVFGAARECGSCRPSSCVACAVSGFEGGDGQGVTVLWSSVGEGGRAGPRSAVSRAYTRADDRSPVVIVDVIAEEGQDQADREDEPPKAWIGVRMSPLPAALAAHLGQRGLMIANIVENSPADKAGLERFDVVLSFDGKPLNEMEDLVEAVRQAGAGSKSEMVIVRAGKEKKVSIEPAEPPSAEEWTYKYEEPDDAQVDESVRFFGHRLRQGPGGKWILEPLGKLKDWPETLRKFEFTLPKDWSEPLKSLDELRELRRFRLDPLDPGWPGWGGPGDDEAEDAHVEIQLNLSRDGESTVIHRRPDGTIQVQRTNRNGERTEKTYQNVDELRREDPEAHGIYERHTGRRGGAWMVRPPDVSQLPRLRWDFQEQFQRQLDAARRQLDRLREQVGQQRESLRREAREDRQERREGRPEDRDALRDLRVKVHVDGRISVSLTKNGQHLEYEFNDKQDCKAREPELYGKIQDLID